MGMFDADWVRTHKRMCNRYEYLAVRNFERDAAQRQADVQGIIAEIIQDELPELSQEEGRQFVQREYIQFKEFDFRDHLATVLRGRNPDLNADTTEEIYSRLRHAFHRRECEHEYFLFFVISKVIELRQMSISRIDYMLEIARGHIPRDSRIVMFFKRWRLFAHYSMAKEKHGAH